MKIEWEHVWRRDKHQTAVLIPASGEIVPDSQFSEPIDPPVPGLRWNSQYDAAIGDTILLIYETPSTTMVSEIWPGNNCWPSLEAAEDDLALANGSLGKALYF